MSCSLPYLLWVLLLGMSLPAWANTSDIDTAPPWRWPSLREARPDSGRQDTAQLLEWMLSPEIAQRSEAQIRLLVRGDPLLPQLEALAARRQGEDERRWMREYLQILTLWTVPLERLAPHPTLNALAQEGIKQGLDWVEPWRVVDTTADIERRPDLSFDLEGPSLWPLRTTLARLGGLARPALDRLMASPSAAARARAIALASRLTVRPSASTLERLWMDESQVTLVMQPGFSINDDVMHPVAVPNTPTHETFPLRHLIKDRSPDVSPSWVNLWRSHHPSGSVLGRASELSTQEMRNLSTRSLSDQFEQWSARWFSIVKVPGYDPDRESGNPMPPLRRFHAESAPRDEQEYWNLVRPLWRAWWASAPWGYLAWDREASNFIDSYAGIQCSISKDPGARAIRIEGPPGAEVEVIYYPDNKQKGEAPVRGPVPFMRTTTGPWANDWHGSFSVRMRTGKTWVDFQRFSLGERNVLWLQPELHQAFLQWSKTPSAAPLEP